VSGATIAWSASNAVQFSACKGASSCSVLSDEAGESSSWVTPTVTGPSTITIALAPASYSPAQTQQATLVSTSTTLDLAAVTPTSWVGQGATIAVPLTVEALDLGVPVANVTVDFAVTRGTAALSSNSATTNASGFATVTANLTNINVNVQVSACVAPSNAPCQTFTLFPTAPSRWTLETVSGSSQFVLMPQPFQPLVMRVTDGSAAANPVMGVNVTFATTLARTGAGEDGMPVLLGSSQVQVASTQGGLAFIVPSAGSVGPCDVFITVSAGTAATQFQMENLAAIVSETLPTGGITVKIPAAPRDPRSEAQASPPLSAPTLFAVPELYLNPGNDPPLDHAGDCSEPSASPSPSGSESPVFPPCASNAAKGIVHAIDPDVDPTNTSKNEARTERDAGVVNVPSLVEAQPFAASSTRFPEDKRSCRVLAADGPIP
jgi:hypothetical protein